MLAVDGFHRELTGASSFLYGTILGLDRQVIEGSWRRSQPSPNSSATSTPLKRYRLGCIAPVFAIAMLFPANVYCFDEVLAVVDGEFKDRCLPRSERWRRRGRRCSPSS